jgi:acetyl-CoA synthetase
LALAWAVARIVALPPTPYIFLKAMAKPLSLDQLVNEGIAPAWFPNQAQIQATNIAALMRELGIDSYGELHKWSVQNRSQFWDRIIQRLGIRFRQPYTQIVDLNRGVEFPQWLVGARFNIAESCWQAPPDRTAIVCQPEGGTISTWTYGQLRSLTNRVANGLLAAGCQPGEAIAIAMPMTAESVAIYLGIVQAGGVVVSIADSFAPPQIATRLQISQAKAIFTQDYIERGGKQLPLYAKVVEAQAPKAIVLTTTSAPVNLRSSDLAWDDFLGDSDRFEAIPADPGDRTNILFSSGTTGEPKAIPWTQTTPIKCAADGHLHHDIHPEEVLAWPTNLGWMIGPWSIYASFINQATLALYYGTPTQREFGQFVCDARVNILGVVPSLVSAWKTTGCMQGLDWSAIKAFSSTGECSNPQDMLYLMSLAGNKPIVEYCGGTEIGGGYITGTLVQPSAPATFSTLALGVDAVILDEEGRLADKGEMFIIPPSIGLSTELLNQDHHQTYFALTPSIAELAEALPITPSPHLPLPPSPHHPLRRHGDRMERLPNGYYRALGRVDDTMNLGGIKVSAAEIERVVNAVEGVCETAAIAISPTSGGPSQLVIYAVVEAQRQQDKATLMAQMQSAIRERLNPLFKIHDLAIVEALPRTASNKVMRRVLRDRRG